MLVIMSIAYSFPLSRNKVKIKDVNERDIL